MKVILTGSGGCMRELAWQMLEQNELEGTDWQIIGFVDKCEPGKDIFVNNIKIPYLGNDDYILNLEQPINVVLTVGSPDLRKKLAQKFKENPNINFPNIILGNVSFCKDLKLGKGCIISKDTTISTNVNIGDFVFINMANHISHDCIIRDFVTLSPSVSLAGAVEIGSESDLGLGCLVIQCVKIGSRAILGAGAVVVKNIDSNCVAVGIPARKIKGR